MSNVLTFFFFFYSCLYGGTELFHTRLCFGAPSGQSHQIDQMSSWGEQWWSLLVTVGKPSLFFFFFKPACFECNFKPWFPWQQFQKSFLWFAFVDSSFKVFLELILFLQSFSSAWISFVSLWVSYQLWFLLFVYIHQSVPKSFVRFAKFSKISGL